MVAFALQTIVLMGAAYFLGTALACVIRRSLFAPRYSPVERRVDPLPEVAQRNAEEATVLVRPAPPRPAPAPPQPVVQPPPAAPAESGAQDLGRIRRIDAATASALNQQGINRYEQVAGWMRADVQRVSKALGLGGRINQENWIEQASVLAKGGETFYSARRARGETASATPAAGGGPSAEAPSSNQSLPRPMSRGGVSAAVVMPDAPAAPATPATTPLVSERAAFAGRGPSLPAAEDAALDVVPGQALPIRPVMPSRDNLQRIGSITPEIERGLNAQGISRYVQIAQWSSSDVERFEKQLLTDGRIARENWVEQAQILSRGGDTRFSRDYDRQHGQADLPRPTKLADAIREQQARASAPADLGSLRSVRSQAYQDAAEPGPEAAQRVAAQNRVVRANADDLKRIRGIGVLIEKKLNQLGVVTYDHIANWTAQDIERVSQSLDFKGRIERENWVEQARILSAGGHTEFSRRVDRGEVETSRPKT
jgi:predicted flap endonuclease-1-like 5' DNA nuclease